MYSGAYLNKPEKHISSSAGENACFVYGVAQMQGWRTGQEVYNIDTYILTY